MSCVTHVYYESSCCRSPLLEVDEYMFCCHS